MKSPLIWNPVIPCTFSSSHESWLHSSFVGFTLCLRFLYWIPPWFCASLMISQSYQKDRSWGFFDDVVSSLPSLTACVHELFFLKCYALVGRFIGWRIIHADINFTLNLHKLTLLFRRHSLSCFFISILLFSSLLSSHNSFLHFENPFLILSHFLTWFKR